MSALATLEGSLAELEPSSAVTLRAAFEQMFAQCDEWAKRAADIKVTSLDQTREMRFARECRLALREVRTNAEHTRKRLKEDGIRRGKAIDGLANIIKACIEPIEAHLLEQEQFADRHHARVQAELATERAQLLVAYGSDPHAYASLGEMSAETWESTKESARLAHEHRKEEARKAELVRLEAERLTAERLAAERVEKVRLEAERVERERALAAELEATKAKLAEQAEQRKAAEQARVESEQKAEREKHAADLARQRELEAKDREHQAQQRKLEAEAKAARDAKEHAEKVLEDARLEREKRDRDAAELAEKAALAPDREKLRAFAGSLRTLAPRGLTTERGKKASVHIAGQLAKLSDYVSTIAGEL